MNPTDKVQLDLQQMTELQLLREIKGATMTMKNAQATGQAASQRLQALSQEADRRLAAEDSKKASSESTGKGNPHPHQEKQ
jgi:hypothetical protein